MIIVLTDEQCNGKNPCSNCIKFKQNCSYTTNSDRRRRKYHTDYVDFLEVKVSAIEKFIKEFIKDDPELHQVMNEKLKNLSKFEDEIPKGSDPSTRTTTPVDDLDPAHEELIDDLLTATEQLRIDQDEQDDQGQKSQYTTELQDLINKDNEDDNGITSTSSPISLIGLNLVFRDLSYSCYLIDLFEQNFAIHSMALIHLIPLIKEKNFNYINQPTLRLFMTCVYGIGSIFATHPNKKNHEEYFTAMARDSLMSITCKCKVDIYIILSLYLLSNYELGQGNLHQSYLMNAMACSLAQQMGLHIAYDDDFHATFAPRSSPLKCSILWSICLHDRLITSLIQVPCVIHFKRIISPFYKISTNSGNKLHISDLSFAYLSRLWYIYDRYTDQIFSTNFDVGDTNNREKVLIMALKTLKELLTSLPIQLRLKSLNLETKGSFNQQNLFILIFNFNYYVAVLQLNKIFVKENPNLTRTATVEAAIKAANVLSILNKDEFPVDKLPYNFGYLVHSVSLVLLFILTAGHHSRNLSRLKSEKNILELYQDCIEILTKFATNWPSAELHLNHLQKLAEKYNLNKNFQSPTSSRSSSPLTNSIQSALEQINNDLLDEQFVKESTTTSNSSMNNIPNNITNNNNNNNGLNPFQLFEVQFPMFGLNQEENFQPIDYNQELNSFQQSTGMMDPQFMPPQVQYHQQQQPQPVYNPYQDFPTFPTQQQPQSSPQSSNDMAPLDEEFIHDAKFPELPNINF